MALRIGINCFRITPNYKGGINSFTFGLLDGFAASRRGHQFVIFVARHNYDIFARYEESPNFKLVEIRDDEEAQQRLDKLPWQIRYRLPLLVYNRFFNAPCAKIMEDHADIFYVPYGPSPLFPYPYKPTVYSIHDMQHVHYPQFFSDTLILERKATFRSCSRHAALIQASSRYMRDDFLANLPALSSDKVVVIREGVDLKAYAESPVDNEVQARHGLPADFLFYPAQLWHHKNHITILKALQRLRHQGMIIPLVLTGAKYSGAQHLFDFIEQNSLSDQVFHLGTVPHEDIVALHHAARFLITASLFESSSLPTLEAAAAGTPIIASNIPAHAEHAEEFEMQMFTPTDDAELANLLMKIWSDKALVTRQVEHNITAIRRFDWSSVAEDYLDAFEALAAWRKS